MPCFVRFGLIAVCLCLFAREAGGEPRRRALLIGINDYSTASAAARLAARQFPNLRGAVNDVELMRGILDSVYHFQTGEIVTLTNRQATRDGILKAIDEHLIRGAGEGDILLFYYSGHGSQVRNSLSEEEDRLDESIVPADIHQGAADIRDKELRRRFLPVLERGAKLTIILDSCHSGSGMRGLPGGGTSRIIPPDVRDVKDGYRGPTLEENGALILSAARDEDTAFEVPVERMKLQGVFTWAWARAITTAASGEPAMDLFRRTAARMSVESPKQIPAIAGNAEARFTPFLGTRKDRRSDNVVVAVRSVNSRLVSIHGGWANGLTVGSELRPVTDPPSDTRIEVIELDGVTRCTARIKSGTTEAIQSGSLLELVTWAAAPEGPLRVWIPEGSERVFTFARTLAQEAKAAGLVWLDDPLAEHQPARILRWSGDTWELFDATRQVTKLGAAPDARVALKGLARGTSLLVQIPASAEIARRIGTHGGVQRTASSQEASYILTGRLNAGKTEYAWVRHSVDARDRQSSPLPLRSDWHDGRKTSEVTAVLNEDLRRLQRIYLWHTLPSPPETRFNYRLGIRRTRDNTLVTNGLLRADERYGFVMRAGPGPRERSTPRYLYVFMVDSYGKSVLFFPRGPFGSVENRFPHPETAPDEIRLGPTASMIPNAPFGTDTYFLLSTDEALPDPWILEWDGVQAPKDDRGNTPLERVLLLMMSGDRGALPIPPGARWSIERIPYTSLPDSVASRSSAEAME